LPVIFILVLGCFVLAMLWFSGAFSFARKPGATDTLAAMRNLLAARAEGRIGQEEFERRQAALHLAILEQPAARNKAMVPLIAVILVLALGYTAWNRKSKDPGADSSTGTGAVSGNAVMPTAPTAPAVPAQNAGDLGMAVQRLEAKLEKNPNNRDGWLLLAQSYKELGRLKDADNANARAAALTAGGK